MTFNMVTIPLALWAVYLLISFLYHLSQRTRYALIIETAGTQYTALSGPNPTEIDRIMGEIVGAIEDPPDNERILQVSGDIVLGDKFGGNKFEQGGSGNRMIINP